MKKLTPFLIAILICVSGTIRAEQPNAANKSEQTNNTEGLFNPGMDESTTMSVTDPNANTEIKADQKDSTQLTKDGGDPVVIYVSSGVVLVLIIILLIILL